MTKNIYITYISRDTAVCSRPDSSKGRTTCLLADEHKHLLAVAVQHLAAAGLFLRRNLLADQLQAVLLHALEMLLDALTLFHETAGHRVLQRHLVQAVWQIKCYDFTGSDSSQIDRRVSYKHAYIHQREQTHANTPSGKGT